MKQWLYGRKQNLAQAKKCVLDSLPNGASQATRYIIEQAFATSQGIAHGKLWPDKVLVRDSGTDPEFRVQCEIDITDPMDADALEEKLFGSNPPDYDGALKLVRKYLPPDANDPFRRIVEKGLEKPSSTNPPA
jgi:hypothetical protein